jgi:hypothetical protein
MMFKTWRRHQELNLNITFKSVHYVGLHYITLQNVNPDNHNKNILESRTQHISPHFSLWGRQPSMHPEDAGTHVCTEHQQPPTRLYTINPQDHSKNNQMSGTQHISPYLSFCLVSRLPCTPPMDSHNLSQSCGSPMTHFPIWTEQVLTQLIAEILKWPVHCLHIYKLRMWVL